MAMTIKDFGLILGWLISGILLLLRILEYRRDKSKVKVTVKGHYGIIPEDTVYRPGDKIIIRAVNEGRRPITLVQAGLLLPQNCKDHYAIANDSLKIIKLGEGEPYIYILDEDPVKRGYNLTPDKYIAYVMDATGRFYWSHNKSERMEKLGRIE